MKILLKSTFGIAIMLFALNLHAQSQMTDEQKEEARVRFEAFQKELNLTDEQKPKFKEINLSFFEGLNELKNSDASKMTKYRKFKALDSTRDDEMEVILTEEQFKRFKEIKKENRDEFKARRKGD